MATPPQTVFVRLPPDVAELLRQYAMARGQNVDDAARDVIISAMSKMAAIEVQRGRKPA